MHLFVLIRVNLTEAREEETYSPNTDECSNDPSYDLETPCHKDPPVEEDYAEFREAKSKDVEDLHYPLDLQIPIIQRHKVAIESQPLPFQI